MNRRNCLLLIGTAVAGHCAAPGATKATQLHVDLDVDPAQESELIAHFRNTFRPAISKQPGFIEVKLLKLRSAFGGQAPQNTNCRLIISFETESQRLAWVATEEHQRAWPTIKKTLKASRGLLLYDVV